MLYARFGHRLVMVTSHVPNIIDYVSTFHPREVLFPSDHYAVEFSKTEV